MVVNLEDGRRSLKIRDDTAVVPPIIYDLTFQRPATNRPFVEGKSELPPADEFALAALPKMFSTL
jgi:hypothetical protein